MLPCTPARRSNYAASQHTRHATDRTPFAVRPLSIRRSRDLCVWQQLDLALSLPTAARSTSGVSGALFLGWPSSCGAVHGASARSGWPVAYALFVAAAPMPSRGAWATGSPSCCPHPRPGAGSRRRQALAGHPGRLTIVLLTWLIGDDLDALFLRGGDLAKSLRFGLISFGVWSILFCRDRRAAGQLHLQHRALCGRRPASPESSPHFPGSSSLSLPTR